MEKINGKNESMKESIDRGIISESNEPEMILRYAGYQLEKGSNFSLDRSFEQHAPQRNSFGFGYEICVKNKSEREIIFDYFLTIPFKDPTTKIVVLEGLAEQYGKKLDLMGLQINSVCEARLTNPLRDSRGLPRKIVDYSSVKTEEDRKALRKNLEEDTYQQIRPNKEVFQRFYEELTKLATEPISLDETTKSLLRRT